MRINLNSISRTLNKTKPDSTQIKKPVSTHRSTNKVILGPSYFPNEYKLISIKKPTKDLRIPVLNPITQPLNPKLLKVSLFGFTNSGKSRLINELIERKVTIETSRPFTTREIITTIMSRDNQQVVLLDNPSLTREKTIENNSTSRFAVTPWTSLEDADMALVVIDSKSHNFTSQNVNQDVQWLLESIKKTKIPMTVVFNKADDHKKRLELSEFKYSSYPGVHQNNSFAISCHNSTSIAPLKDYLFSKTKPVSKWLYSADQNLYRSNISIILDIIRSRFINFTIASNIPFYASYKIDYNCIGWTELPHDALRIDVEVIFKSSKVASIFMDKKGLRLIEESISRASRNITELFNKKVYLFLHLK